MTLNNVWQSHHLNIYTNKQYRRQYFCHVIECSRLIPHILHFNMSGGIIYFFHEIEIYCTNFFIGCVKVCGFLIFKTPVIPYLHTHIVPTALLLNHNPIYIWLISLWMRPITCLFILYFCLVTFSLRDLLCKLGIIPVIRLFNQLLLLSDNKSNLNLYFTLPPDLVLNILITIIVLVIGNLNIK